MYISPISLYPIQNNNRVKAPKSVVSKNINFQRANYMKVFEAEYNMVPKNWNDVSESFKRLFNAAYSAENTMFLPFVRDHIAKHDLKYNLLHLTWNKNTEHNDDYYNVLYDAVEKHFTLIKNKEEPMMSVYNYNKYLEEGFFDLLANGIRYDARIFFHDLTPGSKKTISFGLDYNTSDMFMHKDIKGRWGAKGYTFYDPAEYGVGSLKEESTFDHKYSRINSKYYKPDGSIKY